MFRYTQPIPPSTNGLDTVNVLVCALHNSFAHLCCWDLGTSLISAFFPSANAKSEQQDDSSIGPTFPYLRSAAGGPVAANDGSGEYGGGRGHYRRPQPDFRSSAATTGGGNTLNVGPSTIASSSGKKKIPSLPPSPPPPPPPPPLVVIVARMHGM